MNDLEKENQELKERISKLEAWIKFYEENERQRMWAEAAEDMPRQSREINRNYRMSQLPKL